MKTEIWKTIDEFNGFYEVSNMGRVRSIDREIYNNGCRALQRVKGVVLTPVMDNGGYPYVILYDSVKKFRKTYKVHRLVAFSFCSGYQDGLEVNHINGIRNDNRAENLEWVTRSGNMVDKFRRGYTLPSGENGYMSKLLNSDIPKILTLFDSGVCQRIIARAFNVSKATISNVINNKYYKEVSNII